MLNQHKIEPLSLSELKGLVAGVTAQLTDKITALETENKQLRDNLSAWQANYAELNSIVERDYLSKLGEPEQQKELGHGVFNPISD